MESASPVQPLCRRRLRLPGACEAMAAGGGLNYTTLGRRYAGRSRSKGRVKCDQTSKPDSPAALKWLWESAPVPDSDGWRSGGLDWGLVRDSLGDVSPSLLLMAVAVFMFASYIRALRWQVLFLDDRLSTWRLFIVQNEGIGLNNVVPVRVASEATQIAVLSYRDGVRTSIAVATLGMERVIDVVASTLILAVAFFLVPEMGNFTLYVWGAVGFAIVMVVLLRLLAWVPMRGRSSTASHLCRRLPRPYETSSTVRQGSPSRCH